MQIKIKPFILFLFLFIEVMGIGQEAFKTKQPITLKEADSLFLSRNLLLLAEKYNVDAARAQVIQAGLFNNITFGLDQNIYNPETKEWFDMSDTGETALYIQKLFLLAGKRNKRITLADLTARREEHGYYDLLRTLKFSLHSDFYNILSLQLILGSYERQISSLEALIGAYEQQLALGFVSKKEVLRLKSSLFSVENEKQGYETQLVTSLTDFNLLLHTSGIGYIAQPATPEHHPVFLDSIKLITLIDTAMDHREDLQVARTEVHLNEADLAYQKSLAVPDLTMGAGWDRNGSYVHDYNYVSFQIDLPFFNRNQGNIKTSELNIKSSKATLESAVDKVKADVIQAYSNAVITDHLLKQFDKKFLNELENLNTEMAENYKKRNISILEFLDYYDAYRNNFIQLTILEYNHALALENLNFSVGKAIITNE